MKPASSQVVRAVRKAQPFTTLSDSVVKAVIDTGVIKSFADGELLLAQGDLPHHMFVIIAGQLRTHLTSEDGGDITLRLLEPGESCMGVILFTGSLSPYAISAVGDTKLLQLPSRFIRHLVIDQPDFAASMLHLAASNYRGTIAQVDAVTLRTPFQRIGHYLLVEFIATNSDALTFDLRFKKSLIANHLGMTPETLSRAFHKMRALGIITDGRTITMKDAFALCHFCDLNTRETCPRKDNAACSTCDLVL